MPLSIGDRPERVSQRPVASAAVSASRQNRSGSGLRLPRARVAVADCSFGRSSTEVPRVVARFEARIPVLSLM